jgi:hypothetical protein
MKKAIAAFVSLGAFLSPAARSQSVGFGNVTPFNTANPTVINSTFTAITGWDLSYSNYTYPTIPIDSIAIGSMYKPDHRGFDNTTGQFTGLVNGACPSFGLPDPRCAPTAATPPEPQAEGSIAIGQNAKVLTTGASVPEQDVTAGEFGVAIGSSSEVTGYHGVAVGLLSQASGIAATAYGPEARAQGLQAIAVGDISTASGERSIAIGALATADSPFATAQGYAASANAQSAVALGAASTASGFLSTALGSLAEAADTGALAVGSEALASGSGSVAVGSQSISSGVRSVALGTQAVSSGTSSFAAGDLAAATGTGSTAIGPGSAALSDFSTAIGFEAVSDKEGLIVIGGTKTTEVRIGEPGSQLTLPGLAKNGQFAGKKYQSGETELVTVDENGVAGTQSSKDLTNQIIDTYNNKMKTGNLPYAINSTGALVAAMSAVPTMSAGEDEPARCGIGTGGISNSYAFAAGCAVKINNRLHLNGAISFTDSVDYFNNSSSNIAGRIGFSFPLFVQQSSKDASSEQASIENFKRLKAENNSIKEENRLIRAELAQIKTLVQAMLDSKTNNIARDQDNK